MYFPSYILLSNLKRDTFKLLFYGGIFLKKYDVIVVGTGNAALSSAISAKENGSEVLVLEKAPKEKRGGNSIFTDGAIRFAYNDLQGIKKVVTALSENDLSEIQMPNYNTEDFYKDILKVTNGESNPELTKFLANESFETILWMKKQGVEFQLNENQYFEINGNKNFWGGLPIKTVDKGIGLMNTLFKRSQELGIDIIYSAEVNKIEMDHNKVSAATYLDNNKQRVTVNTEAIILACGSFEASKDKRVKNLGEEWEKAIVRGTEYNTGDGIEIATEIGANKAGHYDGCHAHTTDYNAPKVGDFSKPGDIYKKSSYPLGLIINKNGKRFVDEGADFRNYTYAKYGKETLRQPDQKAFQIFDSQVSSMLRKEYNLTEATKIVADTLEELATKMDINPNDFVEMIDEYNSSVQDGDYNPSVKDGKSTKGISPEKTNWALKFDQAPYYAFPITCGITFAFGGISTNTKAEALDEQNNPIDGLFVAGEMVGGLFYHNYPGGSGLMSGSVYGKRAGKSAAEYAQKNKIDN